MCQYWSSTCPAQLFLYFWRGCGTLGSRRNELNILDSKLLVLLTLLGLAPKLFIVVPLAVLEHQKQRLWVTITLWIVGNISSSNLQCKFRQGVIACLCRYFIVSVLSSVSFSFFSGLADLLISSLGICTSTFKGLCLVFPTEVFNASATVECIEKYRCTGIYGVTTILLMVSWEHGYTPATKASSTMMDIL